MIYLTLMEVWKVVPNTDGKYQCSNLGNCRGPFGPLKPTLMKVGYLSIALSVGQKVRRQYVHRLVAECFLGRCGVGNVVHHRNHDKTDNRAANLEIVSRSENGKRWAKQSGARASFVRRKPRNIKPPATWKQLSIPGYEVSDEGHVWSNKTNRVLRPGTNGSGYHYCCLRANGKTINRQIHKIVIEAFLGPVPKGKVIDHINGDKTDNCLSNLRIVTPSDNIRYGSRTRPGPSPGPSHRRTCP